MDGGVKMGRLILVEPTMRDKAIVLSYKREFIENGDSMDGTSGLINKETYEAWIDELLINADESTVMDGYVPATTYLVKCKKNNQLVGMINIRHKLNDFLLNLGGHIGYSVRKSERRKGYATEMLGMALIKCASLSIDRVLITCDKENFASAKTILNNGGILENEVKSQSRITQRYWIKIND